MEWIDALCRVGPAGTGALDPDALLHDMDRLGVHRAVLAPWDAAVAVYNREGNAYTLTLSQMHPDRFWAYATVNPWYGDAAIVELRRAAGEGARALYMATHQQGCQITDTVVRPVVETAIALGLPMYFVTGVPVAAMPMQLSYVARTYPEGRFIEGRFGFPDFWTDAIPSVDDTPNIVVDISHNAASTVMNAVDAVGAGRVLYASDAPTQCLEIEVAKMRSLQVTDDVLAALVGGTARKVFKGGGAQ